MSASVSMSLASAMSSIASSTRRLRRRASSRRMRRASPSGAEQQAAESPPPIDRRPPFRCARCPHGARNPNAAHQRAVDAGRGHFEAIAPRSGSATSSTGDSARETVSQSSMVMVPSGRSAMICRCSLEPGNLDPNQTVTDAAKHGLDDGGGDAPRLPARRCGGSLSAGLVSIVASFACFRRSNFRLRSRPGCDRS